MTIAWLVSATCTSAQEVVGQGAPIDNGVTAGDVVYSTDSSYIATPDSSYSPYGMNYSPSLGMHLRARYNTKSYGQVRGNLDLGTMKVFEAENGGVWFVDGQVTLNDESKVGYNAGIGYRFMTLPLLPNSPDSAKIAGISFWTDGSTTINENFLPQVGISLEYLGDFWDARANTYIPFADIEVGDFVATDTITYQGDFLVQETIAGTDEALTVQDVELARRLGERDLWLFAGAYGLWGETVDTLGLKLGARGYLTPDLAVQLAVNDDDEFGTNTVFSVTWFIGRTRDASYCNPSLMNRMREPVIRNDYVAVKQDTVLGGEILEGDLDGDGEVEEIRVVHVDSAAAAGGDGSFENPLNNLEEIDDTGASPGIVLVHAGSSFTGEQATLLDGQRMLGEGGGIEHIVSTTNFGDVTLPETSAGASTGVVPIINGGAGEDVITLASNTLEVSNFTIDGGANAIVSPSGTRGVDLNNLAISNMTGNGITLTPGTIPDDPSTSADELAVQFTPMLSDLTFDNVAGDDINLDGTSPEAASVPVTESIAISDVTSTNNGGVGINLANTRSTATIDNYTNDSGTGTSGILLTANDGSVNITDSSITNHAGMGVSVVNSDGSHSFGLDITDTGGAAMHVNDGATDIMFTGKITQGDLGEVLLVEGGHTGALDFFEGTEDDGVVDATSGDGMVFNNADGVYTFVDGVTMTNTTQAINASNDSDGSIAMLDATVTDTTGTTLEFNGGEMSLNFTGKITQNNAVTTLLVENEHTGTLTFNELDADSGVIDAFNGDGMVFNNADGGYIFNDAVVLDGTGNAADTGIDILNDSEGTFTFADGTITSPTGEAISVDGGSSTFTFTGEITQDNNVATMSVTGGHTGTMTFLSPDTSTDVISATNGTGLQFDDADGDYGFVGSVTLDGSAVAADTGIDIANDSDGTFTFTETTITDPTGIAVNVDGGSADVDFAGLITQSNNAAAVSVSGGHDGTLTFSEAETGTGVIDATNGTGLQFDDADGTYQFNDAVVLNGGDAGIDIINDSDGTFTFSDTTITDPTGVAMNVVGGSADVTFTGKIEQSNNVAAISVTGGHDGVMNFNEVTNGEGVVEATNGTGLQFDNADGTYNFNDAVVLNGGDAGIDIINGSSGTFTFASDSEITNPTGDAFVITGSNADVNYNGTITDNTGHAVRIENNTGGTVTFGGEVTSTDLGILVQNNTGGDFNFLGGLDLDTTTNDAVTLTNNTGTTTVFSGLDINTTTGNGLVANGSEGLGIIGTGNSITTTTGVALDLNNVEVDSSGMLIDSVSVTGAVNGIVMDDVTGGQISIGSTGSSQGDGGTLTNTTGDSIVLTNVQSISINHMEVMGSLGNGITMTNDNNAQMNVTIADTVVRNSAAQGVSLDATGSGVMRLALNDNTMDTNADESIALNIDNNASTVHITVDGNNVDNSASNNAAFSLVASGASGKTVSLLVQNNNFSNNDGTAGAADILIDGNATVNANVLTNSFVNSDNTPGPSFLAETNNGAATLRLNLNGNSAMSGNVGGNDDYFLTNTAGTFQVEDLADLTTNNSGEFNQTGVIVNDAGNIPLPQQPQ
ncbi:beta strand repeat-containing protein [Aeoliella sp.]|uniref:beta strand repeat-containing protein n=1 Tax=Aeoliella sp. TaxID=2795800 RepID=UPI003CCBE475